MNKFHLKEILAKIPKKISLQTMATTLLFVSFAIGLYLQNRLINLYYDDFGNASLSYGYDSSAIQGTNYSLRDLLSWGQYTYFNWGGRVLYAYFLILLTQNGSSLFFKIQTLIIIIEFLLMCKIIKQNSEKYNSFLTGSLLVAIYGTWSGTLITQGIYWASASVLYIWSIVAYMCATYIYLKTYSLAELNSKINTIYYIILFFCVPLVTLSQEQYGGAFVVQSLLFLTIHKIQHKKFSKLDLYIFLYSLGTFLIFFLAPGNWKRMATNDVYASLSLVEKLRFSFPNVLHLLTHKDIKIFGAPDIFSWYFA